VLLFNLTIALATGLLFGLAPALRYSKVNLTESLKSGGRSAGQGIRQRRLQDLLAAAEIALALVLLIGAALLLESYARMYRRDPGYRPEGAQAMLLLGIKPQPAAEIVKRVAALRGVDAAGTVSSLPGWPVVWPFDFRRIEIETAAGDSSARALYTFAGHGYFDAMGFTLLRGRRFTEEENLQERYVTVVNQELARRYSLGPDPIGKRIRPADTPPDPG
jgi:putative ABC transport system permease protein